MSLQYEINIYVDDARKVIRLQQAVVGICFISSDQPILNCSHIKYFMNQSSS